MKKESFLGGILEKIVGSDDFLNFIRDIGVGDFIEYALSIERVRETVKKRVSLIKEETAKEYDIKSGRYYVDDESKKFFIELAMNDKEKRERFKSNFKNFLKDLRSKFGKGFDMGIKFYEINKIRCFIQRENVVIEIWSENYKEINKSIEKIVSLMGGS